MSVTKMPSNEEVRCIPHRGQLVWKRSMLPWWAGFGLTVYWSFMVLAPFRVRLAFVLMGRLYTFLSRMSSPLSMQVGKAELQNPCRRAIPPLQCSANTSEWPAASPASGDRTASQAKAEVSIHWRRREANLGAL